MPHELHLDERTVYAWCAWDTLFLPEILGTRAKISSQCPETNSKVELVIGKDGIEEINPKRPGYLTDLGPDEDPVDLLFEGRVVYRK